MALKLLKNNRGSITPMVLIIAIGLIGVFCITYAQFHHIKTMRAVKLYAEVASDDLLAGFDSQLLKNYGLLAYDGQDASTSVNKAVQLNMQANFTTYEMAEVSGLGANGFRYEVSETLMDGQRVAEAAKEVALYHLPKEIMGDLNGIYKWSDKIGDKVRSCEKMMDMVGQIQKVQDKVEKYYKNMDDLNDLMGHDADWFNDVEIAKATNQLQRLENKYKTCIKQLKSIKKLTEATETLTDEQLKDSLSEVLENLQGSSGDYSQLVSEDGSMSIDEVIEELEDNIEKIDTMISNGDYDDVGDLNREIYTGADDKGDSGWFDLFMDQKEYVEDQGYSLSGAGGFCQSEAVPNVGHVDLNFGEKIMLNEYLLGVLKTSVSVPVRDFEMLNREERASVFQQGEVEYIITGSKHSTVFICGEIFFVRFGCNMLHVALDPDKRQLSVEIGSLIGGWVPGGSYIGTALVMVVWSGLESALDVQTLKSGKGVPFVKIDASWQLDIDFDNRRMVQKTVADSGEAVEDAVTDEYYDSYYNDYLRLFLMQVSDSKKIGRLLNVIRANESQARNQAYVIENQVMAHTLEWGDIVIEGSYYEK
ncbi:MAG: hypothetical protein JXO44_00135 [Clostridia bacterium]|nr:hypothetical protein [Clostridia bacterium]